MEFQQLRCFREVAATESYSKAADNIGISRTAVRQNIKELESSLSANLFFTDDAQGNYHLTEQGAVLLQYANRILSLQARLMQEVQAMKGETEQVIRILYNDNLLHTVLPRVCQSFHQTAKRQNAEFSFKMNHHLENMEAQLKADEADIAFSQSSGVLTSELNYIPIAKDQLYVLLPKNHRLAYRRSVRLIELANEPLILPNLTFVSESPEAHNSMLEKDIVTMFEAEHVVPFIAPISGNVAARIAYVQAGLGYTITSGFPMDDRYLSTVEIDNPYSRRNVYMLWPKNRELSKAAELFRLHSIDFFKNKHDIVFR